MRREVGERWKETEGRDDGRVGFRGNRHSTPSGRETPAPSPPVPRVSYSSSQSVGRSLRPLTGPRGREGQDGTQELSHPVPRFTRTFSCSCSYSFFPQPAAGTAPRPRPASQEEDEGSGHRRLLGCRRGVASFSPQEKGRITFTHTPAYNERQDLLLNGRTTTTDALQVSFIHAFYSQEKKTSSPCKGIHMNRLPLQETHTCGTKQSADNSSPDNRCTLCLSTVTLSHLLLLRLASGAAFPLRQRKIPFTIMPIHRRSENRESGLRFPFRKEG